MFVQSAILSIKKNEKNNDTMSIAGSVSKHTVQGFATYFVSPGVVALQARNKKTNVKLIRR